MEPICQVCLKPAKGIVSCFCDYIGPITDSVEDKKTSLEGDSVGTKHDTGKPQLSLIPRTALEAEARVFGYGAKKYDRFNFKKGFKYSRLIDAALRHIYAFNDGEDLDPETGESHLAHGRCCLGMLLDIMDLGTGEDDRFKKPVK